MWRRKTPRNCGRKKELKGFEKILLQPGESKTVRFILGKRAFAYYSAEIGGLACEHRPFRYSHR